MRITNKMLSNNFLRDMKTNLNNLSTVQTQMATGKQVSKASDDPAKASKIMQIYSDIDSNKQYNDNITNTTNWLDMTDTSLGQVGDVTTRIQELLVSAGNAGYGPGEKAAIKDEINQKVGELSQILNTSFDGKYLFGGTNGTSKPVGTSVVDGNTELNNNVKLGVVATLAAGTMTSSNSLKVDQRSITLGTDTLTVDGQPINVNWDTLTVAQRSQIQTDLSGAADPTLNSVKDTIVNVINKAIDDSGTGVSHVSGSLEDTTNKLVLQSGSTGTKSKVTITTAASATSIGAKILSDTAGAVSSSPNCGTSTYSGNTVSAVSAPAATFNMSLNGVPMVVKTTDTITKGTTSMTVAATYLQKNIQTAIDLANGGKTSTQAGFIKPATVTATDDGRFQITSPSGTITFSDNVGTTTAKDLGLSGGSKDSLLVEVSQGVTMDYNITASQVINYGVGGNNLMDLLANITKHLDSTDATDTAALNGADLTGIQSVMTNVLKLRSEVGAKQNRMESAQARNVDQNTNMTEILSTTEDIDITEKTMEYATLQTVYTASLQTSAKVLQPSLLDYL